MDEFSAHTGATPVINTPMKNPKIFCLITAPNGNSNETHRGVENAARQSSGRGFSYETKKEHADLPPRERRTANCFEALETTHNRSQPGRRPMADERKLYPEERHELSGDGTTTELLSSSVSSRSQRARRRLRRGQPPQ
jgi:hypothetical protein